MILALLIGAVAYYFDKLEIPPVPIVLAFVMGSIIELNMNRAMTIHSGDITVVLTRPITMVILAAAVGTLYFAIVRLRSDRLIEKDN